MYMTESLKEIAALEKNKTKNTRHPHHQRWTPQGRLQGLKSKRDNKNKTWLNLTIEQWIYAVQTTALKVDQIYQYIQQKVTSSEKNGL